LLRAVDRLSFDFPGWVRIIAIMLLAAGVGVWGVRLFAPQPAVPAPMYSTATVQHDSTAAISAWFGGRDLSVRVQVIGLLATDDGSGAALLSVNGARAQAFRVGQSLVPGVELARIAVDHVVIRQDGVDQSVPAPAHAAHVNGFRPVKSP